MYYLIIHTINIPARPPLKLASGAPALYLGQLALPLRLALRRLEHKVQALRSVRRMNTEQRVL